MGFSLKGLGRSMLPVAGGVGGFLVGGPVGASVGAGLGGALASQLDGGRSGGPYGQVDPNLGRNAAVEMQRGRQLQRLQLSATGQGPSLAQMQANAALQQGRASLESMAASDRRNPALARRNAMLQGGNLSARIGQQAMMGRLAEQQQAEQALAQAIHSAQQADNQRASVLQNAMNIRYQGAMGQPTNFERSANVLASTLPMVGQLSQGSAQAPSSPPPAQVGSQAHSTGMAYGLGEQGDFQHPNAPQGTWVPTGPYGQGYYK